MAIEKLQYTKDWNNPADFPTIETDETKVRADKQVLHDEARDFINDKLIPAIDENTGKSHEHENKELLDTYTQTEGNLADAVSKKHEHENKELLDTYTQTEEKLADAVSKAHEHQNKELLDTYTQSEENLADAVSKKHKHEKTDAEMSEAISKMHGHENLDALNLILEVTESLGDSRFKVPSEKAVNDAIALSGNLPAGGDVGQVLAKNTDAAYDYTWRDLNAPELFHANQHAANGSDPITPDMMGAAPAEHSHTAADVGAAPAEHSHTADEVGSIKVYNSLSELGLTEASDAAAIVNAMENYSMLLYTMSGTANSGGLGVPFIWGTLRVIKLTASYTEFTLSSGPSKAFAYYNAGSSGDKWSGWRTMSDTTHTHTPASIGAAASSHTQAASSITAGTFPVTGILAATGTDYSTGRIRNIAAGTGDLTAGTSALANGNLYLVYE